MQGPGGEDFAVRPLRHGLRTVPVKYSKGHQPGHFTGYIRLYSEGIEVPVRCWKIGPPTWRPRHMKRLLDALSRVWKLVRILTVLKTARDFMRDHFDDAQ